MSATTSPYAGIGEIEEAYIVNEANDLLKQGLVLIKVIEKTNTDSSTTIVYVLGKPREGQQLPARPQPTAKSQQPPPAKPSAEKLQQPKPEGWTSPPPSTAAAQKALESLKWKAFPNGGGEWAFFLTAAGGLLPELKPAADLIEKMKSKEGTEITLGNYTYKVSKKRFLNRFPAKKS